MKRFGAATYLHVGSDEKLWNDFHWPKGGGGGGWSEIQSILI